MPTSVRRDSRTSSAMWRDRQTSPGVRHDSRTSSAMWRDRQTSPGVRHDSRTSSAMHHDAAATQNSRPAPRCDEGPEARFYRHQARGAYRPHLDASGALGRGLVMPGCPNRTERLGFLHHDVRGERSYLYRWRREENRAREAERAQSSRERRPASYDSGQRASSTDSFDSCESSEAREAGNRRRRRKQMYKRDLFSQLKQTVLREVLAFARDVLGR